MRLTRYHVVLVFAIILGALALMLRNVLLGICALIFWLVSIGLGVAFPQLSLFGPFLCAGSSERKHVALTFDDGPDERSTPALLELLRQRSVQVAFFGVGKRVAAYPDIAARIVREGHLLENHSYAHSNATNFFSVATLARDLTQAQQAIQKSTGV